MRTTLILEGPRYRFVPLTCWFSHAGGRRDAIMHQRCKFKREDTGSPYLVCVNCKAKVLTAREHAQRACDVEAPDPPPRDPADFPCKYRGGQVGVAVADRPSLRERVPVFACSMHEQCTIEAKTRRVTHCAGCLDRPLPPRASSAAAEMRSSWLPPVSGGIALHCVLSHQFDDVYSRFFLPSFLRLQDERLRLCTHRIEAAGNGDFGTSEYMDVLRARCDMVLRELPRIPPKDIAVFLDVDIGFLGRFGDFITAEMADVDLAFMSESALNVPSLINFGFFSARNIPRVVQFLRNVREAIRAEKNDQDVCRELLPTCGLRWKRLPLAFANTNTLNRDNAHRAVLFHAINTAPSRGRTSLELKTQLLSSVLAQRMTREVVVARHTEEPAWLGKLQLPHIVYDKSPTKLPGGVALRNIGREANTYLEHICRHYGELAAETCFVQGQPFDHLRDFASEIARSCDGFVAFNSLALECSPEYTEFDGATPLSSAWRSLFPGVAPPETFRFRAGAQFVVSRDRILSRPVTFYEHALAVSRWTWGPWLLERLWPYVFGLWPPSSACATYSPRAQALEKLEPVLQSDSEDIERQKSYLDIPEIYEPGSPRSISAVLGALYEECQERPDLQRLVLEATSLARRMEASDRGI